MTQTGYEYVHTPGIMPGKSQPDLTAYPSIGMKVRDTGYETAYFGKWHVAQSKMNKVEDWITKTSDEFAIEKFPR